jgi:hypothetical protein
MTISLELEMVLVSADELKRIALLPLESSSDSKMTFGLELVVLHRILYLVIEGQTHFGMPRGAKMTLAINE